MKRLTALLLALCLCAGLTVPALAAAVTVDGAAVAGAQAVAMVPLRATAEALGYEVAWNGALPGAELARNGVRVTLVLGRLQATVAEEATVQTAAMDAAPAFLAPGAIYVPATLFAALPGGDAVSVGAGGAVTITAGQESGGSTQIANPLHNRETLNGLSTAVGFTVAVPDVPAGFAVMGYTDIAGTTAEIRWSDDVQELTYRISRGSSDISGDYTVYPASGTLEVDGISVHWRGRAGAVQVAVWTQGGFSHSLRATDGLTETQVRLAVSSVAAG